jgi:hypothetical protein
MDTLGDLKKRIERLERIVLNPTTEKSTTLYRQVLQRYNRAHGQDHRISLKQVCEQMGASYEAVKKYRQRMKKVPS